MNGIFHKKGNIDRLYMKRYQGGRGLISVEDCVRVEEFNLRNHLRGNAIVEPLLLETSGVLLGEEKYKNGRDHCGGCTYECYKEESGTEYKEGIV